MTSSTQSAALRIALLFCAGMGALAQERTAPAVPTLEQLRAGFLTPPPQARLRCYWWWLNGNTDKPTITHDLEEMKSKGFGGALLVDANGADQGANHAVPAGPAFGSPAWVELYTHALKEADRLGLEITLNITSGWNLGGPGVTPDQASKLLTFSRTPTSGGASHTQLAMPSIRNNFYRQIAVLAYPLAHGAALAPQTAPLRLRSAAVEVGPFSMPNASFLLDGGPDSPYSDTALSAVIDITAKVSADGNLQWTPPAGDWEILRIGYTDSGALVSTSSDSWKGLALDYLSRAAFTKYWDATVEPLLAAAKPYHSLRYLATDSWELGGTNWTDDFRQQFQRLRGYDPVPWLPVVAGRIVGTQAESTRFLTDLRRTVADLIVSEHYDVFAEKAREHGMGIQAESGGPHGAPLDALETFRHSAVPQTEFWSVNPHRATDPERFFTKEAASAANIYGQPFAAQEGETSIGPQWSESLATDLKPSFDMAITEGMNRLVWHEFTSSPAATGLPGQEYFAGTHLNPKVTWWNAGSAFFTYLNRAQFLMQQGSAVSDVLYFYGDNVPSFARRKADDPAHVLPGYDYDVTDEDALLHFIHADGAELVGPSGVRWRLLALPTTRRVSFAVLDLIGRYVRGGGNVVGKPPTSVTGWISAEDQDRFDVIARQIWGECGSGPEHSYGAGRVFCSDDAHAALEAMKIAQDFSLDPSMQKPYAASNGGIDYIHRRAGAIDIYFVRNPAATEAQVQAKFRSADSRAEVWDLVSGAMREVAMTNAANSATIGLHLPAYGSAVVVFSTSPGHRVTAETPAARVVPLRLESKWTLTFEPNRGAPSTPVEWSELKSWTESSDPRIRYFSGSAIYRIAVQKPANSGAQPVYLQFSALHDVAQVRINGHEAGTVWALPYRLEVGKLLHDGVNQLEIEVTNEWPNRIIGDLQPGVTAPITSTNIRSYKADSPLLPSGLIGPLTWIIGDQP